MNDTVKLLKQYMATQPPIVHGIENSGQLLLAKLDLEPLSVSALAALAHSDVSTVSRQANRLTELGLAEKVPSEHDRRVQLIQLTEQGREVRGRLLARRTEHFRAFFADFTSSEAEQFAVLLDKFRAGVQQQFDAQRPPAHHHCAPNPQPQTGHHQ